MGSERGWTGTEIFVAIIGSSLDGIFVAIFFEIHQAQYSEKLMSCCVDVVVLVCCRYRYIYVYIYIYRCTNILRDT